MENINLQPEYMGIRTSAENETYTFQLTSLQLVIIRIRHPPVYHTILNKMSRNGKYLFLSTRSEILNEIIL